MHRLTSVPQKSSDLFPLSAVLTEPLDMVWVTFWHQQRVGSVVLDLPDVQEGKYISSLCCAVCVLRWDRD